MFEQLAESLGVEIKVPFKIYEIASGLHLRGEYIIDRAGIFEARYIVTTQETEYLLDTVVLQRLMSGKYGVVKEPWFPKDYDVVFYLTFGATIDSFTWDSKNPTHLILLAAGNIFRTYDEADKDKQPFILLLNKIFMGARFSGLSKVE